ncbi:unnamed protein product [Kluyveromyces dobzhanskii CBS 2104]|uniref:WGS project CCBQ000000000 data, contig 00010 n=1 Tax=Kluyveromyces dobzhanskii CBS 2104 TaxID=1427455 RepID=A0A0A8LCU8_9SACH|nr:unnamed protein product [Kluyveromyces dobzhanskii CBS 2104]
MNDDDGTKRGNINELIQQFLNIIPEEFFEEYYRKNSDPKIKDEPVSKCKGTSANANKPTKGQILTQAVEYVNSLQAQVDLKNREEVELILKVKELCKETGSIVNDLNLDNTSAELALSRIGVGPLAGMSDQPSKAPKEQGRSFSGTPGATASPASSAAIQGTGAGAIAPAPVPAPTHKDHPQYRFEYGGYSEYNNEP